MQGKDKDITLNKLCNYRTLGKIKNKVEDVRKRGFSENKLMLKIGRQEASLTHGMETFTDILNRSTRVGKSSIMRLCEIMEEQGRQKED